MAKKRKDPPPPKQPSPPSSSEEEEEVEEVEEEVEEEGASESESKDGEASESESESEPEPEEKEDLSNRETLKNIITHFTKDQLVQLLTEYLPRHPNLHSKITKSSESDPSHRRIFVYGLGWDCTTQTLTDAFKKYGPIEDCKAVLDRVTNQCKGYGFVLFSTRNAANNALKEPKKVIGTRTASCQLASKGSPSGGGATSTYMQGSNQGGQPKVAQTPQSAQTSVGLGYAQQPQVNTSFLGQGMNRAVTPGPYEVNNAMHGLYGGNGGVTPSLYGVNSVSPGVIGNYQAQQTALQRMGVNSVSPSVIGNYQSQAALQGLGGYQSQSSPGEPKAGLLPYYRR